MEGFADHLVSELRSTERFYTQALGFDLMMHLGSQAGFVSAGGYHHHVGYNVWGGPFRSRPEQDTGGLAHYTVVLPDAKELEQTVARLRRHGVVTAAQGSATALLDPSGIRVLLETQ